MKKTNNYFDELKKGIIDEETFEAILIQYKYATKKLEAECKTDLESAFDDFVVEMDNKGIAIIHGDKSSFWEYKLNQANETINAIKREFGIVYEYRYHNLGHKNLVIALLNLKALIVEQISNAKSNTSKRDFLPKKRKKQYYIELTVKDKEVKEIYNLLIEKKIIESDFQIFETHFRRNKDYRDFEKVNWIKPKHEIIFFLQHAEEKGIIKLSNSNRLNATIEEHFQGTKNLSILKNNAGEIDKDLYTNIISSYM